MPRKFSDMNAAGCKEHLTPKNVLYFSRNADLSLKGRLYCVNIEISRQLALLRNECCNGFENNPWLGFLNFCITHFALYLPILHLSVAVRDTSHVYLDVQTYLGTYLSDEFFNWEIIDYSFQGYNIMMWYMYTLWNDHHSQSS